MQVTLVQKTRTGFKQQALQELVNRIVRRLQRDSGLKNKKKLQRDELTLVFVSSIVMKKLNFQFRAKNYATDVLSFAPTSHESLGELVFCPAVLKKQARTHGHSLGFELTYMLIHGILHLLGYEHEKSKVSEKKMFSLQDRLFRQLTASKITLN